MVKYRPWITALCGALLLLLLAAPATLAHRAATQQWQAVVGTESTDHVTQGMNFLPGELWINVGDSVTWTAKSGEIHTITFLPPGQQAPPFDNTDSKQIKSSGSTTYDGKGYFNSGIMSNTTVPQLSTVKDYTLTFNTPGDYVYHCLVYPSMMGTVHVRPANTLYPYTQQAYDSQIQLGTQNVMTDGQTLVASAQKNGQDQKVIAGAGDSLTSIMAFYPQKPTIKVGESITFGNLDPMVPHIITFGTAPQDVKTPSGDPKNFDGSQPLNSGYIGAAPDWSGQTFTVTFTKAGTYPFTCILYDYLGMKGEVTVQ